MFRHHKKTENYQQQMISFDDHPPSDPESSDYQTHHHRRQQISHDLKINIDENAPAVSDIDLKSPDAVLDDTNNPVPSFSIRDYVFGLRSKDVACNWPFSRTSLQLCLKHGVKNLLPPFQPLDLLRDNSPVSRCTLEKHLTNETISSFNGKPTNDRFKSVISNSAKSNGELALESVSTNSSGSKGDKESQSHLEEHLAYNRSKEKPPASSQKTEKTSTQTIVKKSRLVMKLHPVVEPVEEVTPNSFIVSETMASKVCPVCKTFSSSSNTTLNAHIDQCLSGESSMKWTANPKVIIKHRVKPRKTRLMVDVYETAPHCTVEELDRRNGTSWATNSSFPAQEIQFQGEEEPEGASINPEVADHEGDVYIDTDGTKVRILSVPKPGSSDNHGARKSLEGVKESKIVIGKKKSNIHKQKHHQKYLKLSPNGRKLCSPKPLHGASEARSGQEDVAMAEDCSKDDQGREPVKAQVKVADFAIIRPSWACSKRTGLAKRFSGKHRKLDLQCHATKDLLVGSDKSSSRCDLRTPPSPSDNVASLRSSKKIRTLSPLTGQPLTSNSMVEFSSSMLTKPSSKHSRKEGDCLHDNSEGSPDACPSQHSDGADIRSKGSKVSSLRKNLSFPTAKFNLKRKFSDAKKLHAHRLLNEKCVDGPSQDSSEEQYQMEENMATRNKEERRIFREERSITSKSSNGESSVGLETAREDPFLGVESVRNETLSNGEQVCIVRSPSVTGAKGSFMGLSNPFNAEFSKLVSEPDNKFESQECVELSQEQLCSTNLAPDGKNIFGNDIEDGVDDVEKHTNFFQEVDPILIPGPPGSFLPSPGGDMAYEELQGDSSLTTTMRIHSSEKQHHHDTMDRDSMSNSPVSTVSNPSLARSDSRSSDKLSYRSASVPDDSRPGSSSAMVDATYKKSFPTGGDWRPVDTGYTEKGPSPPSFKNDQPCCCSRKEGASNYQESSILRKRVIESNRSSCSLSFRTEMFSLSNYPTSPTSETVIFPTTKKSPSGSTVNLPVYSDCDSAASPSKPVLRLMGKNLMVVKTDEDVSLSSQQFRPPQLSPMSQQHPSQQFRMVQKEDHNSFSHGYPQRPIIFSQYQNGFESRHFNVYPPINMRSHVDSRHIRGSSKASVDHYGHGSPRTGPTISESRSHHSHNGLNSQAPHERNMNNATSSSKPIKEIIIIDGSPENEADDAMLRRNRVPSSLIHNSPRQMNPLYTMYQSQSSAHPYNGRIGVSSVFHGGSFQTTLANGNTGMWNCIPAAGSSGMMYPTTIGSPSPSPSTSHFRSSAACYPPSYP